MTNPRSKAPQAWVIRYGSVKGHGDYLWSVYGRQQSMGMGLPPPTGEWGEQNGAFRYHDRPQAVRDAKLVHGRVVRLRGDHPQGEGES